jgi:Double-GTPase 2
VVQTGICLLNNDATTCPERLAGPLKDDSARLSEKPVPALASPVPNPRLPSSLTLSPDVVRSLTGATYWHMIGILGAPDSGKTAALVSLYLLIAHSTLEGFEYRNSLSIRAFEQISRGARRWNEGQPPEQMTIHTDLPDERTAGFLHLRLHDISTGTPIDLLLPDLPGEWSTSLVDSNRVDRLGFLKSADAIWLVVDGQQLSEPETRQLALHRTKVMMQRLATFLRPDIPPVLLVVSRRDFGMPSVSILQSLEEEAARHGIEMAVIHIASFSDRGQVPAGTGIAELVSKSVARRAPGNPAFWPDRVVAPEKRVLLNFRARRTQA